MIKLNILTASGEELDIKKCIFNPDYSTLDIVVDYKKEEEDTWKRVPEHSDFFYEIKCVINISGKGYDNEDVEKISGCIAYALRQVIRGEDLSLPVVDEGVQFLTLTYHYDSTKTQSDDPDFLEAFEKATEYIVEGSPKYKTNRVGVKDTRLIDGIGEKLDICDGDIEFFLR